MLLKQIPESFLFQLSGIFFLSMSLKLIIVLKILQKNHLYQVCMFLLVKNQPQFHFHIRHKYNFHPLSLYSTRVDSKYLICDKASFV